MEMLSKEWFVSQKRNEVPILKCIEGDTTVRYSRVLKIRNNLRFS